MFRNYDGYFPLPIFIHRFAFFASPRNALAEPEQRDNRGVRQRPSWNEPSLVFLALTFSGWRALEYVFVYLV